MIAPLHPMSCIVACTGVRQFRFPKLQGVRLGHHCPRVAQGNKVQGYKEVTDVADGLADRWCTRGACQRSSRYQRRQLSGDIHEGQHGRSTHEETPASGGFSLLPYSLPEPSS